MKRHTLLLALCAIALSMAAQNVGDKKAPLEDVNKVRSRFNVRGIWMLNRIIGSVVMLASVISLIYTILGKTIY